MTTIINQQAGRQNGLTLVEVLVTLVVFALGMLGIALYTGQGLRAGAENNERAIALHIASQTMEPLYTAADIGAATFRTRLVAIFPLAATPPYSRKVGVNANDEFTLVVMNNAAGNPLAFDDSAAGGSIPTGVNWLTNANPWVAGRPVNVSLAVRVTYPRMDKDANDKDTGEVVATYTFFIRGP